MGKNNGGPAFPRPYSKAEGIGLGVVHDIPAFDGMSMRDYFAACALNAYLFKEPGPLPELKMDMVARDVYSIADAMIKARDA